VRRAISASLFGFLFLGTITAVGEEISLKDGTKLVGHMTSVTPDKIEVETSYGKIQVKRSDILTISFPENGAPPQPSATATDPAAAKPPLPKIDESLNGLIYTNRTGRFTLTLPPDWAIAPELRKSPDTLAALSSKDKMRFLLTVQEQYPGSIDSYKDMVVLNARRNLDSFEELNQTPVTIDGKSSLLVYYRGTLRGSKLPVQFVSAIIPSGNVYTKVSVWCIEPLFRDMQPAFEKTLTSYRSMGGQTTASAAKP
jgi:hypothetical protein